MRGSLFILLYLLCFDKKPKIQPLILFRSCLRASVSTLTTIKLSHLDAAQAPKYPHTPPEWFCFNRFQTNSYAGSHFLGSVWSQWICRKCVLPPGLSQRNLYACLNQVWLVKSWKLYCKFHTQMPSSMTQNPALKLLSDVFGRFCNKENPRQLHHVK